ncbi:hypothetical protein GOP47_0010813 [Adiantum capillus-veneris]|uniref:Uncharacterized protein n=1 Tax=Adiantum capillus-veneris TaxID=13818 RepID=A0A9D4UW18_ADICA|nr:hypothetical protein GOP47_0010813 [Adiantum capillus-veneris]
MSKDVVQPPFEQLPYSSHRSISVREQRGRHSPRLRRSASAYNGSSDQQAAPVEIGSKGSIFSLVGRDISETTSTRRADDASGLERVSDASLHYHIWHNRLWLVLPSRSKKHNAAKPTSKSGNVLPTVAESGREDIDGVPTWKRVLRKLKEGYNNSKFKTKWKKKGESLPVKKSSASMRRMSETAATKADFAEKDPLSSPCKPLQRDPSPRTTVWERRAFVQINPLDLSHLHTSRLKKAYAGPQVSTHG